MILLEDKGNKEGEHTGKQVFFRNKGHEIIRVPLPVGDYIAANDLVMDVIRRKEDRKQEVKKIDFIGSYKVSVDTKASIQELVGNICGKQHARFRDECILAKNNNIKLYILVANADGVTCIDDLHKWHNPRLDVFKNSNEVIGFWQNGRPRYRRVRKYPAATTGTTLAKACNTMQEKYGCEFVFCSNEEQGQKVLELLGIEV